VKFPWAPSYPFFYFSSILPLLLLFFVFLSHHSWMVRIAPAALPCLPCSDPPKRLDPALNSLSHIYLLVCFFSFLFTFSPLRKEKTLDALEHSLRRRRRRSREFEGQTAITYSSKRRGARDTCPPRPVRC